MANAAEISDSYDYYSSYHLASRGSFADITCALYLGRDKPINQAQHDKQAWILKGINFKKGDKVLDIGSGWGPMLKFINENGGKSFGLTLSREQIKFCKQQGLNAKFQDWKTINPKEIGLFDGVISVGAFEHFCSIEEFEQGKQEKIYQDFFKLCYDVLPKGGRLYLQTMTWGKSVPDPKTFSPKAPEGSPEKILYRLTRFYPGSWLPNGLEQIVKSAKPYFNLLEENSGRLDYIKTLDAWGESAKSLRYSLRFIPVIFQTIPYAFKDKYFWTKVESAAKGDQQECFKQEIMDHRRMFFEKV